MKVISLVSNISFKLFIQVILFISISLLLIMAAVSSFLPDIEQARHAIPIEVYKGTGNCGCQCILNNRPWYSTFNYWLFLSALIVPFLISFINTTITKWQKIIITLATIVICYLFLNLSVDLAWEITNDLFKGLDASLTGGVDCYNYGDGPARGMVIFLGWIPASLYVGFCFFVRWIFGKTFIRIRNMEFTKW